MIDDARHVVSLSIIRPTSAEVKESISEIVIPQSSLEYAKLENVNTNHAAFPVFAWDQGAQHGHDRGMYRLTKTPLNFVLRREIDATQVALRDALSETDDSSDSASTRATRKRDAAAVAAMETTPRVTRSVKKTRTNYWKIGKSTRFSGIRYRSVKEARYAVFLTELETRFSYEILTFNRPGGGTYTPDFYLPDSQTIIELKPERPHIEEEFKCEQLSEAGFRVVCVFGSAIGAAPFRSEAQSARESGGARDYRHANGVRGIAWCNGEKLAGETVFVVGASTRAGGSPMEVIGDLSKPHLDQIVSSKDMRWNNEKILNALRVAGEYVFTYEDE